MHQAIATLERTFQITAGSPTDSLTKLGTEIIAALDNGNITQAIHRLNQLMLSSNEFSTDYLRKVVYALDTNNWEALGEEFINLEFIGQEGYILLIGPFTRPVQSIDITKLTAIFGRVDEIDLPIEDLNGLMQMTCGKVNQSLATIVAIQNIAVCGNVGKEEAFMSPEGWNFPDSTHGPALVNMAAHQTRFSTWIEKRIKTIFCPATAALILDVLDDQSAQLQEYCLHEAGHAAGMGLQHKLAHGLLPDAQQKGWEEYKTDIVGFFLANKALTPEMVGRTVAATLCIRFGIDAHRLGGPDQDHDALSALLILDRMLMSGQLQVLKNGKLSLRNVSFTGLQQATAPHRLEAEFLMQQELKHMDQPQQLMNMYNWQFPHPNSRQVFDRLVEACR